MHFSELTYSAVVELGLKNSKKIKQLEQALSDKVEENEELQKQLARVEYDIKELEKEYEDLMLIRYGLMNCK